ncbi:MAG: DUF4124 domain-containing protein [Burkholderiales bacterium]|nr:DUF4124 domain-containing protein [Burkholderiales bacterium]
MLLAAILAIPAAHAAEAHKCVAKDGRISYQGTPCPGTVRIPASQTSKLDNLTVRQADIVFDCMEAVDNVVNREPDAILLDVALQKSIIAGFEKHCPALGFQSPLYSASRDFNIRYSKAAKEILEKNGHTGPSYSRTYSGGRRSPPLFSGY